MKTYRAEVKAHFNSPGIQSFFKKRMLKLDDVYQKQFKLFVIGREATFTAENGKIFKAELFENYRIQNGSYVFVNNLVFSDSVYIDFYVL